MFGEWTVTFTFIYQLFQIYFLTDSLSYLNIISLFIIYSFFNNYTYSNIFFIQYLIIIIEKKIEEWTVTHQTWWAIVHEPKKIPDIESPLETIFMVPLSIIEIFMHLVIPLEMLLHP